MSERTATKRIKFEHWAYLAQHDPATFEQLRSRMLDDCIASAAASHQQRLRCLQWRIDRIREKASNPLSEPLDSRAIPYCLQDAFEPFPLGAHSIKGRFHVSFPGIPKGLENVFKGVGQRGLELLELFGGGLETWQLYATTHHALIYLELSPGQLKQLLHHFLLQGKLLLEG